MGYEIEVMVVVEHDEPNGFGHCRNQDVSELHRALLTPIDEADLDDRSRTR